MGLRFDRYLIKLPAYLGTLLFPVAYSFIPKEKINHEPCAFEPLQGPL